MADSKEPKQQTIKYTLRLTFVWVESEDELELKWQFLEDGEPFELGNGKSDLVPGLGKKFDIEVEGEGFDGTKNGSLDIKFRPLSGAPESIFSLSGEAVPESGLEGLEVKNLREGHAVKVKPKKLGDSSKEDWDIKNYPPDQGQEPQFYGYELSGTLTIEGKKFSFDPTVIVGPHKN